MSVHSACEYRNFFSMFLFHLGRELHRERRAGSLRGSAGDDDDDDFSMTFFDAISRSCTWSSCAARFQAVRASSLAPRSDFWRDWHVRVEISSPVCGIVYSLEVVSSAKWRKLGRAV